VLSEADLILAEDTRTSGVLLRHLDIHKPMLSYHKFNEHQSVEHFVERLRGGETIAVVSDAGTPGISDPGFLLAREAIRAGIEVTCLPGPTALIPALVASGLPSDRFCFEGFLPQKKGRQTRLREIAEERRTTVFYESPHRVLKTLQQLAELCGPDRQVAVCRELTKVHEDIVRGTLQEAVAHFTEHEPRGEFVIVLAGL
jgi:16S rRNA (cytidine1402-2'-O)-methyltransferase